MAELVVKDLQKLVVTAAKSQHVAQKIIDEVDLQIQAVEINKKDGKLHEKIKAKVKDENDVVCRCIAINE